MIKVASYTFECNRKDGQLLGEDLMLCDGNLTGEVGVYSISRRRWDWIFFSFFFYRGRVSLLKRPLWKAHRLVSGRRNIIRYNLSA